MKIIGYCILALLSIGLATQIFFPADPNAKKHSACDDMYGDIALTHAKIAIIPNIPDRPRIDRRVLVNAFETPSKNTRDGCTWSIEGKFRMYTSYDVLVAVPYRVKITHDDATEKWTATDLWIDPIVNM